MKTFITAAAATALMATGAFAQATQTGVVGASGDPTYSLQVTASNGQTYNCIPQVQTIAGVPSRQCVNANPAAGGLGGLGAGLGAGGGVAAAALVVLAVAAGGSSSTTTTTSP